MPRLSHLRQRRLHIPRGMVVPEELDHVVVRDVSLDEILSTAQERPWAGFTGRCISV